MRSIDGPGAVSGRFVDYDAVTNPNGTVYTADFGNDVQDELIGIQEAGGISSESAGTNLQVLLALYRLQNGISPNVSAWSAVTTYGTAGTLVYIENAIYAATGETGNLDKSPTAPGNAAYWENFDIRTLKQAFSTGAPIVDCVSDIHDTDNAIYQQYFKMFQSYENGVEYYYYFVHLDGTVLSGTLETIMTSYPHLDVWAPDDGGTRTLFDATKISYDTGWVTPSDWTAASETISHSLNANFEDIDVLGMFDSDESGVQSGTILGYGDYSANGATITEIDEDSLSLQFANEGPISIGSDGLISVVTSLTNSQYRLKVTNREKLQYLGAGQNYAPGIIVKVAV